MSELDDVRKSAFQRAGNDDEFAVCCSDGDLTFASTRDEAESEFDEMKSLRDSLNPFTTYEYDIIDLSASKRGTDQPGSVNTNGDSEVPPTVDGENENRLGSATALMKGAPEKSRKAPTSSAADWRAYFPYDEPREAQIDGIENVIENASDRGYTLLEGACGTGKTLVGLCAGLELVRDPDSYYEQVLCLTSVKQQIRAFEDDLREINQELREQAEGDGSAEADIIPDPVSAITLVGKGDVCSYTNTGKIDTRSIYGRCEDLREPVRRTAMYADDSKSALRKLANEAAVESSSSQEQVAADQWEAPYMLC